MNFEKIVNPETNRKVKTKGKTGKQIIKNYIEYYKKNKHKYCKK